MRPAVRVVFAPLGRSKARGVSQGRTIWLDPRLPDVARTYLHELLHIRYPSWSEKRILREESKRWRRMTWRQKARLYQALAHAKMGTEPA